MKEKFKELSKNLRSILELGKREPMHAHQCGAINEAADFLQSLADMPDEPERNQAAVHDPNTDTESAKVDAEYADWWMNNCLVFQTELQHANTLKVNAEHTAELLREHNRQLAIGINSSNELVINKNMELMAKDKELAAANARIKQLEHSLLDKMTAENQAMGLYDQPKHPILEPEIFNALTSYIEAVAYGQGLRSNASREYNNLRKLLVGG